MNNQKIKILVDGNCIVCDMEISHYKRMKPEVFEIVDISASDFCALDFNLETAAVNKHLHVLCSNGKVLKGVDAFIAIWEALGPEHPYFQKMRKIISFSLIKPIAQLGYFLFAEIRPFLPKKK